MFHKAVELTLLDGTALEVQFQDGKVKHYDVSALCHKYPQMKELEDRERKLQHKEELMESVRQKLGRKKVFLERKEAGLTAREDRVSGLERVLDKARDVHPEWVPGRAR